MAPSELTVYLCASDVTELRAVVRAPGSEEQPPTWFTPQPDPGFPCLLAARVRTPRYPPWTEYLAEHFQLAVPATQPVAAVLLAQINGRIFAVTFGRGHDLLRKELIVGDFGIRITANSIDPGQIKAVSATSLSANPRRTDQSLASPAGREFLSVGLGDEWIRRLSGRCSETGRLVHGSDAYHLPLGERTARLRDLRQVLTQALERYEATTYRERFDDLDRVQPLNPRDPRVERLDAELRTRLSNGIHTLIGCSVPEEFYGFGDDEVATFEIHGDRRSSGRASELRLPWIQDRVRLCGRDPLHRLKVRCRDSAGEVVEDRELRDFLTAELVLAGERYVLLAGNWIKVRADFYRDLEAELARVPDLTDQLRLAEWWNKADEGSYNAAAATSDELCLLDRKNFHATGQRGGVEICDLLSQSMHLICVKRLSRSATLSHLFAQGHVSARLWCEDGVYRAVLNRHYRLRWGRQPPRGVLPTIVYAIGTERDDRLTHLLPFFSRVNLRETVKAINGLNPRLRVAVARIPMTASRPDHRGAARRRAADFPRPSGAVPRQEHTLFD